MLWLRRTEQDCAYRYISELNLDGDLRKWLDQLHQYHTAFISAKRQEYEDAQEAD